MTLRTIRGAALVVALAACSQGVGDSGTGSSVDVADTLAPSSTSSTTTIETDNHDRRVDHDERIDDAPAARSRPR